jgi:hypothetical protein
MKWHKELSNGEDRTAGVGRASRSTVSDVKRLVEKYRAIFDWDVPEVDQNGADKLILGAIRKALEDIDRDLSA